MTQARDFLVHDGGPSGEDTFLHTLNEHINVQTSLLREILRNQRRLVPTVRTATVVHTAGLTGQITDTHPHKITFEIGGKPVTVHKILIGGVVANSDRIRFSLEPVLFSGAMQIPTLIDPSSVAWSPPTVLNISVSELYVVTSNVAGFYVNSRPVAASGDVLMLYGFTDDDWPNNI